MPEGTEAPTTGGDPPPPPIPGMPGEPATPPAADPPKPIGSTAREMLRNLTQGDEVQHHQPQSTPPAEPKPDAATASPTTPPADPTTNTPAEPKADEATPAAPAKEPDALDTNIEELDFDALDQQPVADPKTPTAEGEDPPSLEEARNAEDDIKAIPLEQISEDAEVADRVRGAFLKTGRGQRMLASYKLMNDLAAPQEEGGIGFMPDQDTIKKMYGRSMNFDALIADVQDSANDADKAARVMSFLLTDGQAGAAPHAQALVAAMPQILQQVDSDAYGSLKNQIAQDLVNDFSRSAASTHDPEMRKYYAKLGEALSYHLNGGQPAAPTATQGQPVNGNTKPAEVAALEQQIAEMRQQLDQTQQQGYTQFVESFVDSQADTVEKMFGQALPKLSNYLGGEEFAKPYINSRVDAVIAAVNQDKMFAGQLQRQLQQAYKSGDTQARNSALQEFRRRAMTHVRHQATQIQKALRERNGSSTQTPGTVAQNQQLHQNLQQRQANSAAEGQGAPSHQSSTQAFETSWDRGASAQQNFNRMLKSLSS